MIAHSEYAITTIKTLKQHTTTSTNYIDLPYDGRSILTNCSTSDSAVECEPVFVCKDASGMSAR